MSGTTPPCSRPTRDGGPGVLRLTDVVAHYGPIRVLKSVTLEARAGEIVCLLGGNASGKSTTMRILTCFISASGGTAKVHGFDVFDDPLEVRRRVGYLPKRAPLYGDMNVWEYLSFVADMRGLPEYTFKRRMRGIVEVCGLAQVLGKDFLQPIRP